MKVELQLDENCTETRLIVVAAKLTDEISALMQRLSDETPQSIVGFDGDVVSLLSDFMSVRHADFDVESDGNGGYVITIKAEADRFFDMGRTASDVDA